jgi:hypothetical protein
MTKQAGFRERIAQVAEVLVRQGEATEATIIGCSAAEIETVEADVGRPLPLAYREFLAKMGRGAGSFFVGTDLFYPILLGLTQAARDLVAEDEVELVLPEDAIAFLMHQGYQFMFIRANKGEDPAVYYYMERSGEFVLKADRFTTFLMYAAREEC